ncbi:hypothetical protein BDN70DRAFT_937785 [Pholiota conissans]|uniref:Uncharacterized protein n=1 Tax=Pholiota conissans TaxID=109636 RepID=A0A9P5YND8_9AGAR|nr:hypothetical protein BDN70DRAFT_937785 [Pholiota conissans]
MPPPIGVCTLINHFPSVCCATSTTVTDDMLRLVFGAQSVPPSPLASPITNIIDHQSSIINHKSIIDIPGPQIRHLVSQALSSPRHSLTCLHIYQMSSPLPSSPFNVSTAVLVHPALRELIIDRVIPTDDLGFLDGHFQDLIIDGMCSVDARSPAGQRLIGFFDGHC